MEKKLSELSVGKKLLLNLLKKMIFFEADGDGLYTREELRLTGSSFRTLFQLLYRVII